jgi:hypothetical protein
LYIEDIYWACKGICDEKIEYGLIKQNKISAWEDIDDLIIPTKFMQAFCFNERFRKWKC